MTKVGNRSEGRVPSDRSPVVRVLMLDFDPVKISELWRAAARMLPAIEVRMYCRTCRELEPPTFPTNQYDIILVDSGDQQQWSSRLAAISSAERFNITVVISGTQPAGIVQSMLLRAGYADVICVQDDHAKTVVSATIKAYLRQLRAKQIELPSAISAPIQRALI